MKNETEKTPKLTVAIIGGGLVSSLIFYHPQYLVDQNFQVGSLAACFFAKRGHDVTVYEYREGNFPISIFRN